jgi:hypothetical protein
MPRSLKQAFIEKSEAAVRHSFFKKTNYFLSNLCLVTPLSYVIFICKFDLVFIYVTDLYDKRSLSLSEYPVGHQEQPFSPFLVSP